MISEGKSKPACILSMRKDFLQSIRVLKFWLRPFAGSRLRRDRPCGSSAPEPAGKEGADLRPQAGSP